MAEAGSRRRRSEAVVRLLVAHALAYPVALLWMFGAMPLSFPVFEREIAAATGELSIGGVAMPAYAAVIVKAMLVVGAVVFALEHVAALPWVLAADAARGRRRFAIATGALAGAGALVGAAAWLWLVVVAKA